MANKKDVVNRCNRYLNDCINMVESFEKLTEDFMFDITILDQKKAPSIVQEYSDYVMMLRSTYRDYRFNVENFERYVLRLNSVISSSLVIEYRINDILYNKNHIVEIVDKVVEDETDALMEIIGNKLNEDELKEKMKELTRIIKNNAAARTHELLNQNNITNMKADSYFIGNISKDKELKELIKQICKIYMENELIESVRKAIYKKHKIVVENEAKNKIHCLKMGAYNITSDKLEKVMTLAAQNHEKLVIDSETLDLFNIFLNFNGAKNEAEYKEILNRNTLEVVKEIEGTEEKYSNFADLIIDYAIAILKELRWCEIEE